MTDRNSSQNNSPEMRRKQDTIPYTDPVLSPPDVAAENQLKRSISQSQTVRYIIQIKPTCTVVYRYRISFIIEFCKTIMNDQKQAHIDKTFLAKTYLSHFLQCLLRK